MNRLLGSLLAGTWLIAMAALIHRDVLPLWTAQQAPQAVLPVGDYQIGIFNQAGRRIGITWVSSTPTPCALIRSTTVLDVSKIAGMLPVSGQWLLSTELSYDAHHVLDHGKFTLEAPGISGEVSAERLERDFSVIAKLGDMKKTLLLDGEMSQFLAETLRPFTHLEELNVGQRWRMRLLDPFALIKNQSVEFQTQLAEVTRMEVVEHDGVEVECFRVETPSATAWADHDGRVLKQEVQIPLIGRWTLVDEPFDWQAREAVTRGRKMN
jgi:hypothetical protein